MAQALPTTTITLTDGTRSGFYYSPANGASAQPNPVSVPITIPNGWGLVGISSVLLNANSTYPTGTAASISLRTNTSGGVLLGSGSVAANGDGSGNFNVNSGLRNTGIVYNINDGIQYPLSGVTSIWYQITMGGDASAIIVPSATGTSVQIAVQIAPRPGRSARMII